MICKYKNIIHLYKHFNLFSRSTLILYSSLTLDCVYESAVVLCSVIVSCIYLFFSAPFFRPRFCLGYHGYPVKEAQRLHDETGIPGHVIGPIPGHMTPPGHSTPPGGAPSTGVFQIRPGPKDEDEEDLGMTINVKYLQYQRFPTYSLCTDRTLRLCLYVYSKYGPRAPD